MAGPHRDPLTAYMANLPLNSWQFYHFSSGKFSPIKPKTYKPTHYLTFAHRALYYTFALHFVHSPFTEKLS